MSSPLSFQIAHAIMQWVSGDNANAHSRSSSSSRSASPSPTRQEKRRRNRRTSDPIPVIKINGVESDSDSEVETEKTAPVRVSQQAVMHRRRRSTGTAWHEAKRGRDTEVMPVSFAARIAGF